MWSAEPFTLPAVEDLEWARRVVAAGWKIVYEPGRRLPLPPESPRARARRLIDIGRVSAGENPGRSRNTRRTIREAGGLVVRDSRAIFVLDEPFHRKVAHLAYLFRVACYYVLDFSRSGTTAERRRKDGRAGYE